ncbi:MAG TPA: hypothetical protein VF511_03590 [Chthoniobacterales bacterium]|jgi:hypothetical protein
MKLSNDSYIIFIGTKNFTERYYRDKSGWLKVSARERAFRMTAEQVLNHILPALAGIQLNVTITVEHHEPRAKEQTPRGHLGSRPHVTALKRKTCGEANRRRL